MITLIPTAPAAADVTFTASFDITGYDQFDDGPAPMVTTSGNSIVLPTFSYPTATFSGWVNGVNLYQPGEVFTLTEDVIFEPSISHAGFYMFNDLVVTSNQQLEFFPAFHPEVTDYYLNIPSEFFQPISLDVTSAFRGTVVGWLFSNACSTYALATTPTFSSTNSAFTLLPEDFGSCENYGGAQSQMEIQLGGRSEQNFEQGLPEPEIIYTIHVSREMNAGYNLPLTYADPSPDVQGELPSNYSGKSRWIQIPDEGSLSRAGYMFSGWEVAQGGAYGSGQVINVGDRLQPGDIILLTTNLVLHPYWVADPAEVNFYQVDGQGIGWASDYVEHEVINFFGGKSSLSFQVDSAGPFRITLFDGDDVVSRFSYHPSYSASTVNATETSLETPATCHDSDLADCPVTLSLTLEYWNQSLDLGYSSSAQILVATRSNEVCLEFVELPQLVTELSELELNSQEPYCEIGAQWLGLTIDGYYEMLADEAEIPGLSVSDQGEVTYTDPETGDRYFYLGNSFNPDDDGSDLLPTEGFMPVFADSTLYAIWISEAKPQLSTLVLFGKTYVVEECLSFREDQPENVMCLRSGPSEQNWPYFENAQDYFLAQDFDQYTTTSFTIAFSNSSSIEFELYSTNADLTSGNLEGYPFAEGSSYSTTVPIEELCPDEQCPAIVFFDMVVTSENGYFEEEFSLKVILSNPQTSLSFEFDLDGGTGADTYSNQVQATWMTSPDISNVRKPGFRPAGWVIEHGLEDIWVSEEAPVAIIFDNQTISVRWVPAYHVIFVDGFTDSPIVEFDVDRDTPFWGQSWILPTAEHPDGYEFLAWSLTQVDQDPVFEQEFLDGYTFTADTVFYPIWDLPEPTQSQQVQTPNPTPAPVVQNPQPVVTPPATVSPTPTTSSPVATSSNSVSPTTSTSLGVVRVNGMTEVAVGLPAKYIGRTATIEVKRWINNRVRYFVLDSSTVLAATAAQGGNSSLKFDFKLTLRPTDTIRIKVGKVEVLKKKVGR